MPWRLLDLEPSCSEAKLVRCRCSMRRQLKLIIGFSLMNVIIVRPPIRLCTNCAHFLHRFGALLGCKLLNHLSEHLRILRIDGTWVSTIALCGQTLPKLVNLSLDCLFLLGVVVYVISDKRFLCLRPLIDFCAD